MTIMSRLIGGAAVATVILAASGAANAVPFEDRQVLVNTSSAGFYTTDLGTMLDRTDGGDHPTHSGPGIFPCSHTTAAPPVSCGGDPTVDPIDESNLNAELAQAGPAAVLGNWLSFDNSNTTNIGTGDFTGTGWTAGTPPNGSPGWPILSEMAAVYEIDIASDSWTEVEFRLGVDNGIMVWIDGEYVFGAMQSGGVGANEYTLNLDDLSNGLHYVQILFEDHGGSNGFSLDLRGTPQFVPEPGALALLGLGLVGLGVARRRKAA